MRSEWDTIQDVAFTEEDPVRPLGPGTDPHRPPQLTIIITLLAIGGILGWVAASLAGGTDPGNPEVANDSNRSPIGIASVSPASVPRVNWTEASVVPPIPPSLNYAGFSTAAELNGTTYLVVNYASAGAGEPMSELWRSDDGDLWEADPIWLGEPISSVDLTAFGNSLLLGGVTDTGFGLWSSIPDRTIDGSSWNRIPLAVPSGISNQQHATRVSNDDRIVTTMIGNLEIYPSVVEPYLPDGIELSEKGYRYLGDEFLYGPDGSGTDWDPIQIFAEPPTVLVTDDSIWVRLVTTAGEEVLQTIPLPPGVYPADSAPNLSEVPVVMMWRSDDGFDFIPVTGSSALPEGYFLPEPWDDGFVAAVYENRDSFAAKEDVTLWTSQSGRAWRPAEVQPPHECSPFFLAISGTRIHLTSEDGTQCIRDVDGEWQVLDQASTVAYVVGGNAGFIGYPNSFEYDEAMFSTDGLGWANVTVPGTEPYPTLLALEDSLLALSVNQPRPTAPTRIQVWSAQVGS